MEADSTTYDNSLKTQLNTPNFPFNTCAKNYQLYQEFIIKQSGKRFESHLVEKLQDFGLLASNVKCVSNQPDCQFVCRSARVVDRVQWTCDNCGKKQPVRLGSFFFRLQCSLLQAMQIILAWCEDADVEIAAEHFGTKPRVATLIYDKLDELVATEYLKFRLGGESSVVVAEMYPDCVNRQSPDTTDQPHVHRILMLADTNHIPTSYKLHVIKDDTKSGHGADSNQVMTAELERAVGAATVSGSVVVTGHNVLNINGACPMQQLLQYCDVDMQNFLASRIWRQAITLCAASRDVCSGGEREENGNSVLACANAVQKYLSASLYRLRHSEGFYEHTLRLIAKHYPPCS